MKLLIQETIAYLRVLRAVEKKQVANMNLFGFKVISVIAELPDSIIHRSIVIPVLRKSIEEKIEPHVETNNNKITAIRSQISTFIWENQDRLTSATPEMPNYMGDRERNNWQLLFSVASHAGPTWLKRVNESLKSLSRHGYEQPSMVEDFLCDLAQIRLKIKNGYIGSTELINILCEDTDRPWATYHAGRPINSHQLASFMRKIGSKTFGKRTGAKVLKSYDLNLLKNILDPYLPMDEEALRELSIRQVNH